MCRFPTSRPCIIDGPGSACEGCKVLGLQCSLEDSEYQHSISLNSGAFYPVVCFAFGNTNVFVSEAISNMERSTSLPQELTDDQLSHRSGIHLRRSKIIKTRPQRKVPHCLPIILDVFKCKFLFFVGQARCKEETCRKVTGGSQQSS